MPNAQGQGFTFDQLNKGVFNSPEDSYATSKMAEVFGQTLAYPPGSASSGAAADTTPITSLAVAMMPLVWAFMIAILAIFGLKVFSTMRGQQMMGSGSREPAKDTAIFLVCTMLLAPVPPLGVCIGETIIMQVLRIGSNAGDMAAEMIGDIMVNANSTTTVTTSNQQTLKINALAPMIVGRFAETVPTLVCDMQLQTDNYTQRSDYANLRRSVCGVPLQLVGGTNGAADIHPGQVLEYGCYSDMFQSMIQTYQAVKPPTEALGVWQIDKAKIVAYWPTLTSSTANCLVSKFGVAGNPSPSGAPVPVIKYGWPMIASYSDMLFKGAWKASIDPIQYRKTLSNIPLPQSTFAKLATREGSQLSAAIVSGTVESMRLAIGAAQSISRDDQGNVNAIVSHQPGGGAIMDTLYHGAPFMGFAAKLTGDVADARAGGPTMSFVQKLQRNYAQKVAKVAGVIADRMAIIEINKTRAQNLTKAAGSVPLIGPVVAAGGSLIISEMAQQLERIKPYMYPLLLLASNIDTIPQVAMVFVFMMWLIRSAGAFLSLKLAIAIIAIPETRVGHDAWKQVLALALTPMLAVAFFLISSFSYSLLVESSFSIIFAEYMNNGVVMGGLEILWEMITGELLGKLFAFFAITLFGVFIQAIIIIRGPDWVLSVFGLRGGDTNEMFGEDIGRLKSLGASPLKG